ncbi:C-terminal binding protein [Enterococcus sp. AZ109]|uniref:C-terminal binding protein n=1 Tax=Enterococcus sp. AZ109 TaxID=2774634 RepID=UPI003F262ADF
MKVLISDYPNVLASRDLSIEVDALKAYNKNLEVEIYPYQNKREFLEKVSHMNGLITAFLKLDRSFFQNDLQLTCVAVNATGYDTIDLAAAKKKNIQVVPLVNYCTEDVADHTIALLLSLNRKLKAYIQLIDHQKIWRYKEVGTMHRLSEQTLAIVGCGKIGQAVAKRAQAFGLSIIGYDPYKSTEELAKLQIKKVSFSEIQEQADVVCNHVATTSENQYLFDRPFFQRLKKQPLFLNLGRGANVDHAALLEALDQGWVRGAGLDVLASENPDLEKEPLVNRENVIITPHASFYSEESMRTLQLQSVENLIKHLEAI